MGSFIWNAEGTCEGMPEGLSLEETLKYSTSFYSSNRRAPIEYITPFLLLLYDANTAGLITTDSTHNTKSTITVTIHPTDTKCNIHNFAHI